MVLFEFDKILKHKYTKYNKHDPNKVNGIGLDEFVGIGIGIIKKKFPYYFSNISLEYVDRILADKSNKIMLSCINSDKFDLDNVSSILIYHKTKTNNIIKYYILVLGTHEKFRKFGYGSVILDEFIHYIKLSNTSNTYKLKILLKSLDSSLNFYLRYGFVKTDLEPNRLFYKYENIYDLKNSLSNILELDLDLDSNPDPNHF